jgi:hypothetical protein
MKGDKCSIANKAKAQQEWRQRADIFHEIKKNIAMRHLSIFIKEKNE